MSKIAKLLRAVAIVISLPVVIYVALDVGLLYGVFLILKSFYSTLIWFVRFLKDSVAMPDPPGTWSNPFALTRDAIREDRKVLRDLRAQGDGKFDGNSPADSLIVTMAHLAYH